MNINKSPISDAHPNLQASRGNWTAATVLFTFVLMSQLGAADLDITGKWMVTESTNNPNAADGKKDGKFTVTIGAGGLTVEIGEGTMTTTMAFIPGAEPEITKTTFTFQKRNESSATILEPSAQNGNGTIIEITKDGEGLIFTDDKTITKVVKYDPVAVATNKKNIEEANKPADKLLDQSLRGHLNGMEWTPIECRRSSAQFDERGEKIRVDVTADKKKRLDPSAFPSLIVDLPTKPGEYPLSNSFSLTVYFPPSHNTILINGTLVIYKVTNTSIEFGLTARGQDDNVINGKMTADVSSLKDE